MKTVNCCKIAVNFEYIAEKAEQTSDLKAGEIGDKLYLDLNWFDQNTDLGYCSESASKDLFAVNKENSYLTVIQKTVILFGNSSGMETGDDWQKHLELHLTAFHMVTEFVNQLEKNVVNFQERTDSEAVENTESPSLQTENIYFEMRTVKMLVMRTVVVTTYYLLLKNEHYSGYSLNTASHLISQNLLDRTVYSLYFLKHKYFERIENFAERTHFEMNHYFDLKPHNHLCLSHVHQTLNH